MVFEEGKLGGPQMYVCRVAYALKGQIETTVILPDENSSSFRKLLAKGEIPYKVFSISRITKELKVALRYVIFSIFEIAKLASYFKNSQFDIIYVSGGAWQYKGVIAGKLAGKQVIWHLNDTCLPWIFRRIFTILSSLPDAYIYASERSRDYYGPLVTASRLEFVIQAPVDTKYFSSDMSMHGDEGLIDRWAGKIVIGTVANVNRIKGIDVFVRVAAEMNNHLSELYFVVVGPVYRSQKRYFQKIKNLCEELGVENIEFVGGRQDVRPLLKRFDLYLCTSYAESSPISVWEAMSMGKVIVSTNVGDVSKYVKDNVSGEIVAVADYKNMSNRCISLLGDEKKCESYQKNAARIANDNLDVSLCAKAHKLAYDKLLQLI